MSLTGRWDGLEDLECETLQQNTGQFSYVCMQPWKPLCRNGITQWPGTEKPGLQEATGHQKLWIEKEYYYLILFCLCPHLGPIYWTGDTTLNPALFIASSREAGGNRCRGYPKKLPRHVATASVSLFLSSKLHLPAIRPVMPQGNLVEFCFNLGFRLNLHLGHGGKNG